MPEATVASPVCACSSNLSAVMKSTGRVIFTPFFSALAIRSLTIFDPSSSNKELPIWRNYLGKVRKRRLFSYWSLQQRTAAVKPNCSDSNSGMTVFLQHYLDIGGNLIFAKWFSSNFSVPPTLAESKDSEFSILEYIRDIPPISFTRSRHRIALFIPPCCWALWGRWTPFHHRWSSHWPYPTCYWSAGSYPELWLWWEKEKELIMCHCPELLRWNLLRSNL